MSGMRAFGMLLPAMLAVAAAPAFAAPAAAACARPPILSPLENSADPRRLFAVRTDGFRATGLNFVTAYMRACAAGLLRGHPLERDRLFLRNAPDANVASIYLDEGRMVLEYPFVTADGAAHVPDTDELAEAIFCHVRGASAEEEEESGRCLPD